MNAQTGPYPPQQRFPQNSQGHPSKNGRIPMLPIVSVVLYLIYITAFVILPALIKSLEVAIEDVLPQVYRFVGAIVLFLAFGAVIFWNYSSSAKGQQVQGGAGPMMAGARQQFIPVQTAPGPPQRRFKPMNGQEQVAEAEAFIKAPDIERAPSRPLVVTYPSEVEGGIYGDTFIRLAPTRVLKLRSMIVEPRYLEH